MRARPALAGLVPSRLSAASGVGRRAHIRHGPNGQDPITWQTRRRPRSAPVRTNAASPSTRHARSRIRTYLRKVEEAIASGDQPAAAEALKVAQPELMRGVTKGVFHKNTASRKVSRLAGRVKAMAG